MDSLADLPPVSLPGLRVIKAGRRGVPEKLGG
jgi:hypothetical protein